MENIAFDPADVAPFEGSSYTGDPLSRAPKAGFKRDIPAAFIENAPPPAAEEIAVAFGLDQAFLPHAGVTIASLVANAPGARFRFLIIHDGVPSADRLKFERCARGHRFDWIQLVAPNVLALPGKEHLSRATYFRLCLPDLVPAEIRRLLYLDGDVVVLGDVRELFFEDLGSCAIAAVPDVGMDAEKFADRFGLQPQRLGYFNSGVLLMNIEKLRMTGDCAFAISLLETQIAEFDYGDQCALNLAFWGKWKRLDPLWNVQRRMLMPQERKPCFAGAADMRTGYRPKLIHFTEYNKPWSIDGYHPLIWTYYRYLKRTPYRKEIMSRGEVGVVKDIRRRLKTYLNLLRLK